MAGIYIHIPFCKQRCTYCDFYTQVAPQLIPDLVDALIKEMHLRKDYLSNEIVETIYFGGGTPSLLTKNQFASIFETIFKLFNVSKHPEITFEANPDDLNIDFFDDIASLPFNRISIGIQSFDDLSLKSLNRRHDGKQAIEAVKNAQSFGYKNISIDLIYGLPNQSIENWLEQLKRAFELNVQHISIYGLTYETGTRLYKQRERGEINVVSDEEMINMYQIMLKAMNENGFEAYEISNFALAGFRSQHNSSYWKLKTYLGLGPSAHSFKDTVRQWNISSTKKYIQAINAQENCFESENLSLNDRYNDYIMISLRTCEGIDTKYIQDNFGENYYTFCMSNALKYIDSKKLILRNSSLELSLEGIHISNLIISDLMII